MMPSALPPGALRVGISACLLGEQVRFDGGHKRDLYLVDTLGPFVEWVPVCPEVEIGLGTPRETIRLVRRTPDGEVRLVAPKSGDDLTSRMRTYARRRAAELAAENLSGYVLKKDSPSCGMERVRVYEEDGQASRTGRGLFAEALIAAFPSLPVEEEGRLQDARLRENFVTRLFTFTRLKTLFAPRWTVGQLVAFHTAHKLLLMAHRPLAYQQLGRLVASAKTRARRELENEYRATFMNALACIATPGRHANVMHHVAGYFKKALDEDARTELLSIIADYRAGLVPRIVPLTLLRHYVRRFDQAYLRGQVYLDPHPKELMLLNHV
jgi:uncharacterized protein YbgA (DUF1722 family)/uncharacterized protein YbbK (DUF523 family)